MVAPIYQARRATREGMADNAAARSNGLTVLGIAAGYFACVFIGAVFSVPVDGFAIIWPVRAFLIAMLLLLPPQRWWCIARGRPDALPDGGRVPARHRGRPGLHPNRRSSRLATVTACRPAGQSAGRAVRRRRRAAQVHPRCGLAVPAVIDGAILGVHRQRAGPTICGIRAAMDDRRLHPDDHDPAAAGTRRQGRTALAAAPSACASSRDRADRRRRCSP